MNLQRAAWLLSCSGLVACQGALDLDQYTFESQDTPSDAPADDAVLLRFTPYSSLSAPCAGYGFSLVAAGASPAP